MKKTDAQKSWPALGLILDSIGIFSTSKAKKSYNMSMTD